MLFSAQDHKLPPLPGDGGCLGRCKRDIPASAAGFRLRPLQVGAARATVAGTSERQLPRACFASPSAGSAFAALACASAPSGPGCMHAQVLVVTPHGRKDAKVMQRPKSESTCSSLSSGLRREDARDARRCRCVRRRRQQRSTAFEKARQHREAGDNSLAHSALMIITAVAHSATPLMQRGGTQGTATR